MIIQKSFWYADLLLKKHSSYIKVENSIFVETLTIL